MYELGARLLVCMNKFSNGMNVVPYGMVWYEFRNDYSISTSIISSYQSSTLIRLFKIVTMNTNLINFCFFLFPKTCQHDTLTFVFSGGM